MARLANYRPPSRLTAVGSMINNYRPPSRLTADCPIAEKFPLLLIKTTMSCSSEELTSFFHSSIDLEKSSS